MSFGDISAQFKAKSDAKRAAENVLTPAEVQALRSRITGVLIRDARVARGYSTDYVAQVLDIAPEVVVAWEFGQATPTLPQLELLAYWLEVPVSHFISATSTLVDELANRQLDQAEYQQIRNRMIGAQIRLTRQDRNFTIEYLAEQTGIADDLLQQYEYGQRAAPLDHLTDIAGVLKVNITFFLDDSNRVGTFLQAQELLDEFIKMNPEVRAFIAQPANHQFIEVAMKLAKMDTKKLRTIAEMLLEITL